MTPDKIKRAIDNFRQYLHQPSKNARDKFRIIPTEDAIAHLASDNISCGFKPNGERYEESETRMVNPPKTKRTSLFQIFDGRLPFSKFTNFRSEEQIIEATKKHPEALEKALSYVLNLEPEFDIVPLGKQVALFRLLQETYFMLDEEKPVRKKVLLDGIKVLELCQKYAERLFEIRSEPGTMMTIVYSPPDEKDETEKRIESAADEAIDLAIELRDIIKEFKTLARELGISNRELGT